MKLIATSIATPLEERAQEMLEEEFSGGEEGLVVFPESSFEDTQFGNLMDLARQYNVSIIGTKKIDGNQQAVIVSGEEIQLAQIAYPDMVLLGSVIGSQLTFDSLRQREDSELYSAWDSVYTIPTSTGEDLRAIIRMCSDIGVPFLGEDKANLLAVPASIQHPGYFFREAIERLRGTLTFDARIVYSPLLTQDGLMEHGIYDSQGRIQLGDVMTDYTVLPE